jgi:hypothetical protein
MSHAITRSFVFTSGAGTSESGPSSRDDAGGVPARHALQLAHRHVERVADHAALRTAERDVDHGALPRHPRGERLHLVERDVQVEADAALGRAARGVVQHADAGEDLHLAVVHHHRDRHGDLLLRRCEAPCRCPGSRSSSSAARSKRDIIASNGILLVEETVLVGLDDRVGRQAEIGHDLGGTAPVTDRRKGSVRGIIRGQAR